MYNISLHKFSPVPFYLLLTASLSAFYHFRLWFADWITCCFRLNQKRRSRTPTNYSIKTNSTEKNKTNERPTERVHAINANGMRNTCSTYTAICLSFFWRAPFTHSLIHSQSVSRFVHIFIFLLRTIISHFSSCENFYFGCNFLNC